VSERILERSDLQEMIVNSWEAFVDEIGFPSLKLIGSELLPHESVGNRIDLLAFDEDQGRPVVFELKRERRKLQLLQALSYAAMVWTWSNEEWARNLPADADEDLINSIQNFDPDLSPAVVLIAEQYDPEVILTADWLKQKHDVDVYCFSLGLYKFDNDLFARLQMDYPLRQLQEIYRRRRASRPSTGETTQSWDDVKGWITYAWGARFIDYCRQIKEGDPSRRRFVHMFVEDETGYYVSFQKESVTIRSQSRVEGDLDRWRRALPGAEMTEWGSDETKNQGLTLWLRSEGDVDAFVREVGAAPIDWTI